ncbi:rab-GTPase-TBC domain-containing protein [Coniella lustricola]|uniref:Rab-GTPase-TBC domain-containing protein n=1 Tax=Coniella lustricola TaxID=2025994 RepID=A0A2T3AET2_9PEZI|nr:rab-GTPase-TBC domain-containing protein [Coniella lustricola]
MRTIQDSRTRWEETLKQSTNFADLQRAVKFNGPASPCVAGCRSVCWKAFLLFKDADAATWSHVLLENRNTYSALREHYLKYIKHPELLTELPLDPLADEPDSPWAAFREDELVRSEILQDVQRLPDEPFYHLESTQTLILDILFIWVKLNPDAGGYRQGMHELLAPLLYVVDQDAVDRKTAGEAAADPIMVEMLDSYFLEHDAFALFARLMEHTKSFYEVSVDASGPLSSEQSAIVEKSKQIHEVALMSVDPELANHLKTIEVLPQIFLIRWIRLLFGREFPFEQLLVLWDTIFAYDPTLELIDLVCVAMLIRIRWTLLEADYTSALQLLLKYPAPEPPHGPHTFVDDALYLKDHYNTPGGSSIIMKYTGRMPSPGLEQRPATPEAKFPGLSLRSRTQGGRSPLASPARFISQRGGVEALFQGAAKNVIERGEKLGINQAVRDAMGEIRRNMQDLRVSSGNNSRANTPTTGRQGLFANGVLPSPGGRDASTALMLEQRNKQLALLLDEAVISLKALAAANLEGNKEKSLESVEMAAAKVQFVKIYLEDSSLDLDLDPPLRDSGITTPQVIVEDSITAVPSDAIPAGITTNINRETSPSLMIAEDEIMTDSETASASVVGATTPKTTRPVAVPAALPTMEGLEASPLSPRTASTRTPDSVSPRRPAAVPTRSTIARSSFSLMLEPDETIHHKIGNSPASTSSPSATAAAAAAAAAASHRSTKRPSNAFLFGEVVTDDVESVVSNGGKGFTSDDIFGLEPLRRPSKARGKYEELFGGVLGES